MKHLTATFKDGRVLIAEFADEEEAMAEVRAFRRWREARWGLPCIYWKTVTGEKHVFSPYDVIGEPELTDYLGTVLAPTV